jgi:SNF2 family DNA or RNA helicase
MSIKFKPHNYQSYATQRIVDDPFAGLFLDMGLGKTVSTLTAIDILLYESFESQKVLVIAPLRVAQHTWPSEIAKWDHLKHLRISKVLGPAKKRIQALRADADIWVINRENIEWLVTETGKDWPFDTVIIDESSSFKSPQSKRFKALRRVRPFIKRMTLLTGTPSPNGLMDLWSQMFLLDGGERLGKTLGGYREKYFHAITKGTFTEYKQKKEAEDRVYEAIGDIVVSMKAEDYLNMPEKIEQTVSVSLTDKARALYDKLERELLLPFEDADVTAATAAVLSNKLIQMASGAVYDAEKSVKHIHDSKLDAVEDLIEAANGRPVMIFYWYKHSRDRILERFPQARILRKGAEGNEDIAAWNNNETPIQLLHPKSAGHGLNMQYSDCRSAVWFDQIWALEEKQQATARLHRQGQKHRITITEIIAEGTIDGDVVDAVKKKEAGQDALMNAVKARIDRLREEAIC